MTWDYRGSRYRGKAIENIEGVCKHGDWVYGAYVEGARLDKIPYIIGNIEEATNNYVIPWFWARVDKETVVQGLGKPDIKGNERVVFNGL